MRRSVIKKRSAKKKARESAEYLWRWIVYERANRCCEFCGKGPFEKGDFRLQAHHVVKRSQSQRLQLDPANGCAVCPGCHQVADRDPIKALGWVDLVREGTAPYLVAERRTLVHRTLDESNELLEAALDELGFRERWKSQLEAFK